MAAFNKFNSFVAQKAAGTHKNWINADTDTLKVYLSNTAPAATNTIKANIAEIAAGNGYTAGGADIQNAASQTGGTITVVATDVTWTASGGTIGPFRYAIIYNDTAANDELVGWYDYGSSITLAASESFTVDFGATFLTDS